MHAPRAAPSSADVAIEVADLLAGLGILTIALFPFALPGLLLVVVPLALLAIAGALLAAPLMLALWLAHTVLRRRSRRRSAHAPATNGIRTASASSARRSRSIA